MKVKEPITLRQLLQYLDCENEAVQIASYDDWDTYDEFWAHSPLLEPFLDFKIACLGAVNDRTIRVSLVIPKEKEEN